MIDRACGKLSIARQVVLLSLSRASVYRRSCGESSENLTLMRRIDEVFLEHPFFGSRQMRRFLCRDGFEINRKHVRRLMRLMGLQAIYQKPRTSDPHPGQKVYRYLPRGLEITRANQVWCADISYIPMRKGFLYLVSIMDWFSRKVLAWRLSNTMIQVFAWKPLKRRWQNTTVRRSSTPIRAGSSRRSSGSTS